MKRILFSIAMIAALASCTQEPELTTTDSSKVLASAVDFQCDGTFTRTTITQSGSAAPTFAWKAGDVIGVIPMDGKTVQSNYEISKIDSDPKTATFDGGVWALKEGKSYAAYYPMKPEFVMSGEKLEFSFLGQTQTANNGLEHIGAYDYMYAPAVTASSGSTAFNFKHLVSLVRMQITVPKTDEYTTLTLESSEAWFAGKAELSLADGTMTSTQSLKTCTIALDNISVNSGGVLTVWFATLPTSALDGGSLTAKLYGKDSFSSIELTGLKAFEAGKAYSFSCTAAASTSDAEYVDLGLSVKWASCNLGASSPEQYGGYYQWAGIQDVTSTNIDLDMDNCPYHTGSDYKTGWTKYIPSDMSSYWSGTGSPDNKTVLDPEDDVAHVKLGGKWRMPTDAEWTELRNTDNCTWTWTKQSGVNGFKVTSKKTGYRNNSIFLPAAGYRAAAGLDNVGSDGDYWSSSLYTNYPGNACSLDFYAGYVRRGHGGRYDGLSVRPVSE